MPSKESLELSTKYRKRIAGEFHLSGQCGSDGGTFDEVLKSGYECVCFEAADLMLPLLDEAIREARAQEMEKAIQITASYGHEVTSPFCEEKVAVANCMLSAAHVIEDALRARLAQLREGKT